MSYHSFLENGKLDVVFDPTDEERAAYGARVIQSISANGYTMRPLGRNPTDLVRAYEAGEDRLALLTEAHWLSGLRGTDYTMQWSLERRLFLSRAGGPLEVEALLGESLNLRDVATWFGGVESEENGEDYGYYLVLVLFDEEAVLMRAHHDFGMPEDRRWSSVDLIFSPARKSLN